MYSRLDSMKWAHNLAFIILKTAEKARTSGLHFNFSEDVNKAHEGYQAKWSIAL